jgi:hypothetical protein
MIQYEQQQYNLFKATHGHVGRDPSIQIPDIKSNASTISNIMREKEKSEFDAFTQTIIWLIHSFLTHSYT